MTRWSGRKLLGLLLGLLWVLGGVPALAQGMLWKAEKDGKTVWLYGSIHVGRIQAPPFPPSLEQAYAAAQALVVEADISNEAELAKALPGIFLPPGTLLPQVIQPETEALLEQALPLLDDLPDMIAQTRPWMVAEKFVLLAATKHQLIPGQGVDLRLIQRAQRDRKPVLELESVPFQLGLFNRLTPDEQDAMLRDVLQETLAGRAPDQVLRLMTTWEQGDEAGLNQVLQEGGQRNPMLRSAMFKLSLSRHPGMTDRIESHLKTRSPLLVVVGAGHLVGEGNVRDFLRARGYRVTRH